MSTRLQMGRVGLDIDLPALDAWVNQDDSISLSATNLALGFEEGKALIQQISGLVNNPDEPIVPVLHSPDPSQWGWYRPTSASVTSEALFVSCGHLSFAVTLERISDFAGYAETLIYGVDRATAVSLSVTTPRYWTAYPSSWSSWTSSTGAPTSLSESQETNLGYDLGVGLITMFIAEDDSLADAILRTTSLPSTWYDGACFVKNAGFNLHGRKALIDPDDWSLTNGIVTVGPPVTPGKLLSVQFGTGTVYEVELGYVTADPGPTWNVVTTNIVDVTASKVAPGEAGVRVSIANDPWHPGDPLPDPTSRYLDIVIRRGAAGVACLWTAEQDERSWGLGWLPGATFDDINTDQVGNAEVTPDGDGMRRLFVTATPCTLGNASGRIWENTPAEQFDVWVGFGRADSVGKVDDPQWIQDAYFADQGEHQQVVAR